MKLFLGTFWGKSSGQLQKRAFQDVEASGGPSQGGKSPLDEYSLFWLLGRYWRAGTFPTQTYSWLKSHQHQEEKERPKNWEVGW